jgi:hypothetical protein
MVFHTISMHSRITLVAALSLSCLGVLTGCDTFSAPTADANSNYPKTQEDRRQDRIGKLTGESGMVISGADESSKDTGKNPLGVNSFLWRATLDTLSFMPLASADPFGGVILTDWYEDPKTRGERFKVNALILDRQLRADSIRITSFKQVKNAKGEWVDAPIDSSVARKMEDAVLTRARELRVSQLGY